MLPAGHTPGTPPDPDPHMPPPHPPLCLPSKQVKAGSAKVHWLCLPDSYDEWVPEAAAPAPAPPRRTPRGPWHVYVRWLTDSEKYNEWMNPVDYETDEAAAEEGKRKREGEEVAPRVGGLYWSGCKGGRMAASGG